MKENKLTDEIWKKAIIKAWKDPVFKKLLLGNPREALKEFGVVMPEGKVVKIVESKANETCLTLPPTPAGLKELSDSQLEKLAAAVGCGCILGTGFQTDI